MQSVVQFGMLMFFFICRQRKIVFNLQFLFRKGAWNAGPTAVRRAIEQLASVLGSQSSNQPRDNAVPEFLFPRLTGIVPTPSEMVSITVCFGFDWGKTVLTAEPVTLSHYDSFNPAAQSSANSRRAAPAAAQRLKLSPFNKA